MSLECLTDNKTLDLFCNARKTQSYGNMISESAHSGKDQLESGLCQWKYGGVLLAFIVTHFSGLLFMLLADVCT